MAITFSFPCSNLSFVASASSHRRFGFNLQSSSQLSPTNALPLQTPSLTKTGAIVIGAGLAGSPAATHLNSQNIPFLLLEASDAVGGRVRTDSVDGFLLDRGFQIFITAYPEAQKLLDYQSLELQKFYSGPMTMEICDGQVVGFGGKSTDDGKGYSGWRRRRRTWNT